MVEAVTNELRLLTQILEAIGAFALILGFVIATSRCVLQIKPLGTMQAIETYRRALGRVILIGLEILVAATIIKTIIIDPTLENMGLLAIMIAIRTALGWSTVLEMKGRWPWQKSA
jgi:uncharacterized membrane protein